MATMYLLNLLIYLLNFSLFLKYSLAINVALSQSNGLYCLVELLDETIGNEKVMMYILL